MNEHCERPKKIFVLKISRFVQLTSRFSTIATESFQTAQVMERILRRNNNAVKVR
jgi:hypothetical protein